jgi:hypothetical protein
MINGVDAFYPDHRLTQRIGIVPPEHLVRRNQLGKRQCRLE